MSSEIGLLVAQAISEKLGATLYDLQLLPYCPLPELLEDPGTSDMSIVNLTQGTDYTLVKDASNKAVSMIVFPSKSSFSTKINLAEPIIIKDVKVESECDMYRLCSPNYQGLFDFNPYKNGFLNQLNIYGTLKPYNSFINIQPVFSGLYGQNFQDYRGLRLGGNFSVSRSVNAWQNFELNNKNYQNIFNREI